MSSGQRRCCSVQAGRSQAPRCSQRAHTATFCGSCVWGQRPARASSQRPSLEEQGQRREGRKHAQGALTVGHKGQGQGSRLRYMAMSMAHVHAQPIGTLEGDDLTDDR